MERLGKYEIISEIGRGAMGSVYKARDPLIGRLVALKTITSGLSGQANSLERFYQEARSAGALQHPNIITIFELGHENNTPFIAMEYIEGGSLDHLIEQHQVLPLSVKLGYIVHVCEALSYAHSHNVIHRDIKPANIMVTKEGVVKVVDFGIARLTDMSLTQPNMMIGSRAYMSPQLYKGERADARSDIWAVGVTLYELLANQRPFTGNSEAELMFRIMTDNPPPLRSLAPECAQELADIVAKTLEKKVEDRYQSMEEVTRDLEPIWKSAQQATVAGLLADCQQLVAVNDLQRAQGLLRKALQIDTGNTQVKSLMEKVTAELRRNEILPKVNEHLERGRSFLQTGKLREARAEVEAALGLDSRHETAQKLRAELEGAVARVQEVEQKLRLTKQRLAEGALTEAAAALGRVLEIDGSNPQAQELRHQIEEEKARREKRKKLSEILHHARTLWTTLNYEECLQVLAEGLREFPHEPELIKLQEMARHDLEDLQKQRQLGEVRKLLGQQEYGRAREIIDSLAAKYTQDPAVKGLQTLVLDGEREEERTKRLVDEMTDLRTLLSGGRFADAVTKGDELLLEYPEEFELKEIVDYARGEAAQQEQRRSEETWEKQILELIERENYAEAEAKAKRAAQELPKVELFHNLAEEARQKRVLQEQSERARQELKRRIEEIHGKLQQEKIGDAISLAEQTLVTFGPDPNVTQLLGKAAAKQEEQKKKELQEWQLAEAKTMVDAGNFAGATQVLNQAMATKIFERSDPRVQQRLREIEQLSSASRTKPLADKKPPGQPREAKPGIEVSKSTATKPRAIGSPVPQPMFSESVARPAEGGTRAGVATPDVVQKKASPQAPPLGANGAGAAPAPGKVRLSRETGAGFPSSKVLAWVQNAWQSLTLSMPQVLRKPVVLGAVGGVVALLVLGIFLSAHRAALKKEQALRTQAIQQWSAHELDKSEATWRQIEGLRGSHQNEAAQQIQDIENKRQQESQRFQEGETLLNDQKEYARAAQALQDVVQMNLWLAEKARVELERAKVSGGAQQTSNEEQLHFDQGKTLFEGKAYDQARKEFQAARDLNVPNSQLRPQIDNYLKRIAQSADAKKLYEQALADIKSENLESARSQLQELVDRKGPVSGDAKQRLADVTAAQKAEESFHQLLHAEAYSNAKNRLDGLQKWPKTQDRLLKELRDNENNQATSFKNRASTLQANNDVNGLERLQNEFHQFAGQIEEPTLVTWAPEFDKWLVRAQQALREKQGDKATFEAAVADFNATKEKGDLQRMDHEVLQKFQKIAKGSGAFRAEAQEYVDKTIPAARQQMAPSLGKGKMVVPPILCSGGPAGAAGAGKQGTSCSQMDAGVSLQWVGVPTVEFPASANQPGKLPYVLRLLVFVDAGGKVKIEKNGDVDNDFFKKAKDASKNWRTTIPQVGGKPAKVSFQLEIKFER